MSDPLDACRTTGRSPPRRATVTHIDLSPDSPVGHAVAEGREFSFSGAPQCLWAIAGALAEGERVEVFLNDWLVVVWRRLS